MHRVKTNVLTSSQVDQAKVAAALGMKNVKSVANKVGLIKKKYSLPISTSSKAASADAASPGPAVPKTTAKVIKKGTAKKAPVKKEGKKGAKKDESEGESEQEPEQETEQHAESGLQDPDATVSTPLAVKILSTPELEELCFGPADPEEEEDETQNI
jgi:hypothetical protein